MGLLEKYTDRIQEMQLGTRELENWLLDTTEQGLAQLAASPSENFENIASRLVDLKLGSIANRIRKLDQLRQEKNWRELLSTQLAELYYFSRRFAKIEQLNEAQQLDLLSEGGVNFKKTDVLAQGTSLEDYWIVLGVEMGYEDRLGYQRTWVWAEQQQQAALMLDFAFGNEAFPTSFDLGDTFWAKATYYPGTSQNGRAVFQDIRQDTQPFTQLSGPNSLQTIMEGFSEVIPHSPAQNTYPVLLVEMSCFTREDRFYLYDQDGYYLPLQIDKRSGWRLVAMSGGSPVSLFATCDGTCLRPLSAILQNRIVNLTPDR